MSNKFDKVDVTVLCVNDWRAVYANDEVIHQDHQVRFQRVMEELKGCVVNNFRRIWVQEWFDEEFPYGGRLPASLDDIPDEVLQSNE